MRTVQADAECLLIVPPDPRAFPDCDDSPSGRGNARRGFTLIELLTVIAVLTILISLLLPTLQRAEDFAYKARCLSHLGQLMIAHLQYANDHQR